MRGQRGKSLRPDFLIERKPEPAFEDRCFRIEVVVFVHVLAPVMFIVTSRLRVILKIGSVIRRTSKPCPLDRRPFPPEGQCRLPQQFKRLSRRAAPESPARSLSANWHCDLAGSGRSPLRTQSLRALRPRALRHHLSLLENPGEKLLRAFACEGVARQSKDPLGVATTLPVQELKPGCGFQGSRIMADASATTPKVWVKVVLESAGREPYTLLPVSQ